MLQLERGTEFATTGDGFLLFWPGSDSSAAVRTMLDINNRVSSVGVSIRTGLHWGEFRSAGRDVAGIEVHIASRVMNLAVSNQVLATGSVVDLMGAAIAIVSLPTEHQLKGVIPPGWYTHSLSPVL